MIVQSERERAADGVIAVVPLFHRVVLAPVGAAGGRRATEYRVLRLLSQRGESRMSEASRCLMISKPYLTSIVDALIADGCVERRQDTGDRRVVRIAVTARGECRLDEGAASLRQRLLDRFETLTGDEVRVLSESVEKLAVVLARLGEGERPS